MLQYKSHAMPLQCAAVSQSLPPLNRNYCLQYVSCTPHLVSEKWSSENPVSIRNLSVLLSKYWNHSNSAKYSIPLLDFMAFDFYVDWTHRKTQYYVPRRLTTALIGSRPSDHYFHSVCLLWSSCSFFLLSFFFFSPNLSGHKLDLYHTSTHGVALVRI